jgi:hypothetical protein
MWNCDLVGKGHITSTKTSSDGGYIVTHLQSGEYLVYVQRTTEYFEQFYNGVRSRQDATPVVISLGSDSTGIDFMLDKGGSISGHVYMPDGVMPVAKVLVRAESSPRNYSKTKTASDGSYTIDELIPGEYVVSVEAPGYLKEYHNDVYYVDEAIPVVALRKYLNRSSKSGKIDSLTLAKIPFIDPEQLYFEIHPSDNLRTIPGVGDHTAPIFLATIGDPACFRSQSSFANYCGIVPGASQSAGSEAKGLRMTKAGPAIMRWALFQAGGIGRAHDPQLACIYYREMVHNGKNHMQAMGAVMSHLSSRVLAVLREDKPYRPSRYGWQTHQS